ncbi:MAG: hypothetical protein KDC44_17320 [Phaeodactylibacter sp.]|nr:hypothetical protein [Phaeodactylibacter sp.]
MYTIKIEFMNWFRNLLLLLFCSPAWLCGQTIYGELDLSDTTDIHRLTMSEGDQFVGRILSIQNLNIQFQLIDQDQQLQFNLNAVKAIEVLSPEELEEGFSYIGKSKDKPKNRPQLEGISNVAAGPTGFGLGKGNFEFRNIEIFYNEVSYGLTDFLDIGVSVLPFFALNALSVNVKAHADVGDFLHLGLGVNNYFVFELFGGQTFALAQSFGSVTIGTPDHFLNLATGYGFPLLESTAASTTLAVGTSLRTADRWRFMAESMYVSSFRSGSPIFLTTAMSWFNQRNRLDFGLTTVIITEFDGWVIPVPYISYNLKF